MKEDKCKVSAFREKGKTVSNGKQSRIPGLLIAVIVLILLVYGVLTFYVPHILASYERAGTPLNLPLRVVLNIEHVLNRAEMVVVPVLVVAFFAALAYLIYRSVKLHKFRDQ
ncbi:MAG: hypothetical protein P8016_13405 [Sedimentisphaerales bacterium]